MRGEEMRDGVNLQTNNGGPPTLTDLDEISVWWRYLHPKREKCAANLENEKFASLGGCQADNCAGTEVTIECRTYNRSPVGEIKSLSAGSGGFRKCTCSRRLTHEERTLCRCNYYISGCTRQPCYTKVCDYDCESAMYECPQDIKNDLSSGNRTDYERWETYCPKPGTPLTHN
ncbi:hypothetical protein Fcan01_19165 [Folsomia candida]|uniref:Uncharacterized protein n=1 Tax=Folsomia candida TaxID=158441 RepID=A0A226DKE4_FOLCA|nr:hypothetical protein Fcan01_19165 [Folsomia candida]